MAIIEGIYYGASHSIHPPEDDVPITALLFEHFYAFGIVNFAIKSTQRFSVVQRLCLSCVLTTGSYGLVRALKSNPQKEIQVFARQLPTLIAAVGAYHIGGIFGISILSTIPWNAAHDLDLLPEQLAPISKTIRLGVVYFGTLIYGITIEKVIVIARFALLPFGSKSQSIRLFQGSLMEAIGAAREMLE